MKYEYENEILPEIEARITDDSDAYDLANEITDFIVGFYEGLENEEDAIYDEAYDLCFKAIYGRERGDYTALLNIIKGGNEYV